MYILLLNQINKVTMKYLTFCLCAIVKLKFKDDFEF